MKILGFYISRTDWKTKFRFAKAGEEWMRDIALDYEKKLLRALSKQSETLVGKDGKLRFKHNGQFAPDNRSKFKKTHDQLKAERDAKAINWNDLKDAIKQEEFGR